MRMFRGAVALLLTVGFLTGLPPTSATAQPGESHCVVSVTGRDPHGRLQTTPPRCFPRLTDVAATLSVSVRGTSSSEETGRQIAASSSTIGVHYDGFNFTGSSLTVTGDNCAGGYLNLPVVWRNRISSTINGCPQVRFYNYINLGGSVEPTYFNGNLTSLNNLADSVQYTT